jgi:hypothetical protein
MAAGFIIWTLLALVVGSVIGRAIAEADRQEAARREAMRRHPTHIRGTQLPREWSA